MTQTIPDTTPLVEVTQAIEAADYLVELYKRLWQGGVVRDLAEAQGAWENAKARLSATPPPAAATAGVREASNTDSLLELAVLRIRRAQAEPAVTEHLAIATELLAALSTHPEPHRADVGREEVARICYVPDRVALAPWADAREMAKRHPRSSTGRCVRAAYARADAILSALSERGGGRSSNQENSNG